MSDFFSPRSVMELRTKVPCHKVQDHGLLDQCLPNLTGKQSPRELVKTQIPLQATWDGTLILNFSEAPRWCWNCWPINILWIAQLDYQRFFMQHQPRLIGRERDCGVTASKLGLVHKPAFIFSVSCPNFKRRRRKKNFTQENRIPASKHEPPVCGAVRSMSMNLYIC